jgi:GNAT superfamily N-acetyltransferase
MNRHLVELHWFNNEEGPRPRRKEWPDATAVGSALPTELSNTLFITAPVSDPARLLRDSQEFFGRRSIWQISAPADLVESIETAALAAGMQPTVPVPRMILSPIPECPPLPVGLTVRRVTTAAELRDFTLAGGRGFEIPVWLLRIAIPQVPAPSRSGSLGIGLFVGYANGLPVATSAQMTRDDVVGVFFVATVPEARRRGYGAALTWAAVEAGRSEGAVVSYLHATPMGRSVYERMGYRWVDNYLHWVEPVSTLAQIRALWRVVGLALRRRRKRPPNPA